MSVPAGMTHKQLRSVGHATARVNLWTGSIRSGKTIACLLRWLTYVATAPHGGELVAIGRTRDSIARNLFGPLQDPTLFGDAARHVHYTAGAPTAQVLGRTVHVLGASDARAEAVLRGLTCAGALVDELTLISEPFWTQLLGRLSVPGAMVFATTNPDSPGHWVKKQVIDRASDLGYRIFHFRLTDNTHLDPDYVSRVQAEFVGLWRRRFIDGAWVQAEGAVYDMWDEDRHVLPHDALPPMYRTLALGVDYGTTNPTRGLLLGVGTNPTTGRLKLYLVDEWAPGRGTDAELSAGLRFWLTGRAMPEWVTVDPAAASFKLQLAADGMTNVVNASNDVLAGIRTVASLLATNNLAVSDRCAHFIEQVPGYSWDPKATAKGEDAVIKVDDHEADAARYAIHSTRALWRGLVPLTAAEDTAAGADRSAA